MNGAQLGEVLMDQTTRSIEELEDSAMDLSSSSSVNGSEPVVVNFKEMGENKVTEFVRNWKNNSDPQRSELLKLVDGLRADLLENAKNDDEVMGFLMGLLQNFGGPFYGT